ncbi:MAG TPA: hypothetical protein VJZ27_03080 [Aggregatilineales bacterium]|nr:hypothetical protein [Aggregatilineales bacterium]
MTALFFSAARVVFLGRTLHELEEGHAVLMRYALAEWGEALPPGIDFDLMILGNQRTDMPEKRADGTISLYGLAVALFRAQLLPKYHHGMRQAWNHPVKSLPRVQRALFDRLLRAITTPDPAQTSGYLGAALHTLQDTYTIGHTDRENNADPFSPMLRLHYSPSKIHPLISIHDRVWTDESKKTLTPEARAAVQATVAALDLWAKQWGNTAEEAGPAVAEFVERYTPIRHHPFSIPH